MVAFLQAEGWRGIVPLHSTRAEAERLLGTPRESRGVASTYETKEGKVLVFYSDGKCNEAGPDDWNVPRDTVLSITVHPNKGLLVDDLKLDKTKYERALDYHIQGIVYYFNKAEGIQISARVDREGDVVESITYEPAAKDSYMRCSNSSQHRSEMYNPGHLITKFDEYSDLSFEDEKARLDNFAIYLQRDEPEFKGYMIIYRGPRMSSAEAQARAKRAKDYLVKVRRIAATRIITIDGGCREQLEIELYALPSSISPPRPNPFRNE